MCATTIMDAWRRNTKLIFEFNDLLSRSYRQESSAPIEYDCDLQSQYDLHCSVINERPRRGRETG